MASIFKCHFNTMEHLSETLDKILPYKELQVRCICNPSTRAAEAQGLYAQMSLHNRKDLGLK